MNEQQYNEFKEEKARLEAVGIADLANKAPRTLLYGYNTDRTTFHVYIDQADGLIHVLRYTTAGRMGHERTFVLSHTKGLSGGIDRTEDYVPNKRLYPESCDLEFCRLLRDEGISLPFTTYDAAGRARVDRHNGFAGKVFDDSMFPAVALKKHLEIDFSVFAEPNIGEQLVRTACFDLGVAYTSIDYPEVTMVAEEDVAKVQAKVREYFDTMSPAATRSIDDIEDDITEKSVKWAGYVSHHSHYGDRFGAYSIHIAYDNDAELIDGPDVTLYDGEDGVKALEGTYEGRPYFVILRPQTDSRILVNLMGPTEQFVTETRKFYKLTPKTVTA